MYLRANVSHSRNIVTNSIKLAAFLFSIQVSLYANAGLIEAAKDAACKAFSVKAVVDPGNSPIDDIVKNKVQAVSLFFKQAQRPVVASCDSRVNTVDLSSVEGSKNLDITLSEFTVALINAHVYAQLKLLADDLDQMSFCCGDDKFISMANQNGLFSVSLKSDHGDDAKQFQVIRAEDGLGFGNLRSSLVSVEDVASLQPRSAEFAMTFVAEKQTAGKSLSVQASPRPVTDEEFLEDDESGEASDGEFVSERSFEDLEDDERHALFVDVDSFDPLKASIAFLIFSAVALVVNVVPRRTALTTQL